jgi:hypothetical protein
VSYNSQHTKQNNNNNTTTPPPQSMIQNTRAIQNHCVPKQQCAEIMNTWSFFVIDSGILSLLAVNKYIILTISIVQSVL